MNWKQKDSVWFFVKKGSCFRVNDSAEIFNYWSYTAHEKEAVAPKFSKVRHSISESFFSWKV